MTILDRVKWNKWHTYSGASIKGNIPYTLPVNPSHWEKVVWLTSVVESGGMFGTVISYDGTGATAGLTQAISVYPKELASEDGNPEDDQGLLWKLCSAVRASSPETTLELEQALAAKTWSLGNGKVLDKNGNTLNGRILREALTPNQGQVPRSGPQWERTKAWALLFNRLFSDRDSFDVQVQFAIEHAKDIAKRKVPGTAFTMQEKFYSGEVNRPLVLRDEIDLALAVFYSNSVNAPSMAYKRLAQALKLCDAANVKAEKDIAARIIKTLGTTQFARWNAELPEGRYQRTRTAAMKVWPEKLFIGPTAIMPKRF